MQYRLNSFMLLGLLSTLICTAAEQGYKTADAGRQAMFSAHVTAFSVDNLLTNGIAQDGVVNWYGALKGIDLFGKDLVAKPQTVPTSQANKDLFVKAPRVIENASNELINTVKALRNSNYAFKKEKYADIDLDNVKAQIAKLAPQLAALQNLQKELAPGILDRQDTKDYKKLLADTAYALELTYKKLNKDLDNIKAGIRFAIDQKKVADNAAKNAAAGR